MGGDGRASAQVSPEAIEAEYRQVLSEHYAEGRRGMRSARATASLVAIAGGVALLPAWGPAHRMLGVGVETTVPLATVSALSIVHAAIAFHRVGGLGRWYRIAEHVESFCSVSCGVLLIYYSGSATSVFWIYFLLFVADSWNNPRDATICGIMYGLATAALAVAFAVRGASADAAVATSLGTLGVVCIYAFAASAKHRLRGEAERRVLQRRVESLLVERERDRIARDLHDGVAADLSTLLFRARELKEAVGNGEAAALVDALMSDARSTLRELSEVVFALRVSGGTWDDFVDKLRTRVQGLCEGALRYEVVVYDQAGAVDLPVDMRIHVLRIVQEGVRNAVRHARAREVRVEIARGTSLVVRVSDDGQGISAEALTIARGGVSNISARARILGGDASWSSDHGTRLVVTVPLSRSAGEPS
jgi:signal transduction histidine kinase